MYGGSSSVTIRKKRLSGFPFGGTTAPPGHTISSISILI